MSSFFPETVNVVGNSSVLLDRNYGREIDKNFTIRFNGPPLEYGEIIHFGNRLDCLCANDFSFMGEEAIRKALGSNGKVLNVGKRSRRFNQIIVKRLRKDGLVIDLPCEVKSTCQLNLKNSPFSSGCTNGSNGFLALHYLDYLKVKNVNIFGFTFYKGAKGVFFPDEESEPNQSLSLVSVAEHHARKTAMKRHLNKKGVPTHDWYNEKKIVMNMVKKNNWRFYE